MKEINITKHALMRYASRVYKYQIINDRTWDIWKKANEDKIETLEISLKTEFKESEYICTAAYDNNKKAEFYINKKLMMTYVVNEKNMLTCYQINFELDETGNRALLNVLLDNLKRAKLAEDNFEDKHFENKDALYKKLAVINVEIAAANSELESLKGKKNLIEQELKNIELEYKEIKDVIKVAEEKIVRSKMAI